MEVIHHVLRDGFTFNDLVQCAVLCDRQISTKNGVGMGATFVFLFVGAVVSIVSLVIFNKFDFSFAPFALIRSFLAAVNNTLCGVCSLKTLEKENLSVYSDNSLCCRARLLLLLSIAVLPMSVQHPLLTGGVILSSMAISLVAGQKVSKKEFVSATLSLTGIILLIVIHI